MWIDPVFEHTDRYLKLLEELELKLVKNGDPYDQYHSLFDRLLTLPDHILVYPAHDYKDDTVSTIYEEKAHNPRLQVRSAEEYAAIMNNLNLANPAMMDVAVPENLKVGICLDSQHRVPDVFW